MNQELTLRVSSDATWEGPWPANSSPVWIVYWLPLVYSMLKDATCFVVSSTSRCLIEDVDLVVGKECCGQNVKLFLDYAITGGRIIIAQRWFKSPEVCDFGVSGDKLWKTEDLGPAPEQGQSQSWGQCSRSNLRTEPIPELGPIPKQGQSQFWGHWKTEGDMLEAWQRNRTTNW